MELKFGVSEGEVYISGVLQGFGAGAWMAKNNGLGFFALSVKIMKEFLDMCCWLRKLQA